MELINSNDLIASGIAFSIVDTEVNFDDSGELSGYTVLTDELYQAYDGDGEYEPLCDTAELCDDNTGRWLHLRDAHHSDALTTEYQSRVHRGDECLDYGTMQYWAIHRERRVVNLIGYMRKLARKPSSVQVQRLSDGIRQRYLDSIALIIRRKHNEWWLLYLTKAQYQYLMRCVCRLRTLCFTA